MASGNLAAAVFGIVLLAWLGAEVTFAPDAPAPVASGACTVLVVSLLLGALHRRLTRETETQAAVRWGAGHGWEPGAPWMRPGPARRGLIATRVDGVRIATFTSAQSGDRRARKSGDSRRRVVLSALPTGFPLLTITPQGQLGVGPMPHRLLPGRQLESAEFNARWSVRCADARFAHAFCHPQLMELLLRPDAEGFSVIVAGPDIAVQLPGTTPLDEIPRSAALLAEMVRRVPPHLLLKYPGSPYEPLRRRRLFRVLPGPRRRISSRDRVVAGVVGYVLCSAALAAYGWGQKWRVPPLVILGSMTALLLSALGVLVTAEWWRRRRRAAGPQ